MGGFGDCNVSKSMTAHRANEVLFGDCGHHSWTLEYSFKFFQNVVVNCIRLIAPSQVFKEAQTL